MGDWDNSLWIWMSGLIVARAAFQPIDGLVFLGLRKAKTSNDPFIERGIYRWLRADWLLP